MNRDKITIENGIVSVPSSAEICMAQHPLADVFQCFVGKINANVRTILKTGVLDEANVCRTHYYKNGNSVEEYGLEMIIALSFRIQSRNAELFRKYIVKKSIRNEDTTMLILPLHVMNINNLN